jgi:hypothetical protein
MTKGDVKRKRTAEIELGSWHIESHETERWRITGIYIKLLLGWL